MLTGDEATRLALSASRWRSPGGRRRKGSRYSDALERLETASATDRAAGNARRLALRDNPRRLVGSALVARWAQRRGRARRGPVARWALRRLAGAADRGDLWALYRLWGVWIAEPDDAAWDALAARPRARVLPEALVLDDPIPPSWPPGSGETSLPPPDDLHEVAETARRVGANPTRPAAVRAAIGAFCVGRGLLPENSVEQALFLVLTGQVRRQRAVDPDGAQLSTAYRAADGPTRAAVRRALVGCGSVEAVRAIAGASGGDHAGDLSTDELAYLARELVSRADEDALWRLVSQVRLEQAVAATARFGRWRPAAAADRRLFEQLATAAERGVAASAEHVRRRARTRIDLEHRTDREMVVVGGAFSADVSEVAIVRRPVLHDWRPSESGSLVQVFAMPGGGSVDAGSFAKGWKTRSVLHLGDRLAAVEWRIRPHRPSFREPVGLARVRTRAGGRWSTLWQEAWPQPPAPLYLFPGGFALPARDGYGVAASFPDGDGDVAPPRDVPCTSSPLGEPGPVDRWRYLATEPETGHVAIAGKPARLAIVDAIGTEVATAHLKVGVDVAPTSAAFMGPDALYTATGAWYSRWVVEGDALREVARNRLGDRRRSDDLAALPGHGAVVGLCGATFYDKDLSLVCLDAQSLAERPLPAGLDADHTDVTSLWTSLGGECLAVGERERLTVYDLRVLTLAELLDRPLARMAPADLATATALRRRSPDDPLVDLLAAALEHRFGNEVGLGRPARPMPADPYGLGLSGTDGSDR